MYENLVLANQIKLHYAWSRRCNTVSLYEITSAYYKLFNDEAKTKITAGFVQYTPAASCCSLASSHALMMMVMPPVSLQVFIVHR